MVLFLLLCSMFVRCRYMAFQYPDPHVHGDDIVFVSRTAWETKMGQANRWHDANMMTFHRIRNFRSLV